MQNALTLGVLGLAAYRATQLVVWDSIGDRARDRLEVWCVSKASRARKFIWGLVTCTYCTGWWLSLVTVLVYLTAAGQWGDAPLLVHAVEFWAVAGVQALLNRLDDALPGHQPKGN